MRLQNVSLGLVNSVLDDTIYSHTGNAHRLCHQEELASPYSSVLLVLLSSQTTCGS